MNLNPRIAVAIGTAIGIVLSGSAQAEISSLPNIRSNSIKGALSNYACRPEKINSGSADGAILHLDDSPNPNINANASAMVDGRAVSSCISMDIAETVPASVSVEYRSVFAPVADCSDGALQSSAYGVGNVEVFASPDPAQHAETSWKQVTVLPKLASFGTNTAYFPANFGTVRSILVCRNGGGADRDDIEVRTINVQGTTQAVTSAPSAQSPYLANLDKYWSDAQTAILLPSNQVFVVDYPVQAAYAFMSGWMVEQNPAWKASADRQVQWAHANRLAHGLPVSPSIPGYARDMMAREAIAYYHAYSVFGTRQYLTWADDIAGNMLQNLGLQDVVYSKNGSVYTYRLFREHYYFASDVDATTGTTYCSQTNARPMLSSTANGFCGWNNTDEDIDPNQNTEVGLLLTLLTHDKNSIYYNNSSVQTIARDHLDSSIEPQNSLTGELPLVHYANGASSLADTGYGSYTFFLLAAANSYWQDSRYTNALALGGKWLSNWTSSLHYADHYGNNTRLCHGTDAADGKPCEYPIEMWWRIPAYYFHNTAGKLNDFPGYMGNLYARWLLDWEDVLFDGRIVFLKEAGIPMDYYLPKTPPMTITMSPKYVDYNGMVDISWQSIGMSSCELRSIIPDLSIDQVWDTAKSGTGTNGYLKWPTFMKFSCINADGLTQTVTGDTHVK